MAVQQADLQHVEGMWRATLDRVDASDPRLSVRPHELRDSGQDGVRPSSTGSQEPGLEDLEAMRSGRERFICGTMLGRGGMSVVLSALQRSLGRSVAVKVARYDLDQRQRERFRAESRLTAWLEHPNITPVYEAGGNYLVMRRIAGSDLERQLVAGRLALAQVMEVLVKVCDAVSYAHHCGIIHRDIKPENIMVGDFGEVMLIDWGLALTFALPADGTVRAPEIRPGQSLCAGTPGYMAPEMALADHLSIGPATDVFLLGATLYRILGGDIPFAGESAWQALERSSRNDWLPLTGEGLSPRLVALQERAMASSPQQRPSLAEFQAGLREWLMRSRSEAEAAAALDEAKRLLVTAGSSRLKPSLSYVELASSIAASERALALNPDLNDAAVLREDALSQFAMAAIGAGELQLARLIKASGSLPFVPRTERTSAADRDTATVRRLGKLVPAAGGTTVELLLREIVDRRRDAELTSAENATLRNSYEAIVRERAAAIAEAERRMHARLRRLRSLLAAAAALAAVEALVLIF